MMTGEEMIACVDSALAAGSFARCSFAFRQRLDEAMRTYRATGAIPDDAWATLRTAVAALETDAANMLHRGALLSGRRSFG